MSETAGRPTGRPTSANRPPQPLHERFRSRRVPVLRVSLIWLALMLAAVVAAWVYMRPAPPKHIVIAAGNHNAFYFKLAKEYARKLAANGVELEVRETAGTIENYGLLAAGTGAGGDTGAALAVVTGGEAPPGLKVSLHAIASLYLEPVWVFYRGEADAQLEDLAGKRIAVGSEQGGVRPVALQLLEASGVLSDSPADAPATRGSQTAPATSSATSPATARAPVDSPAAGRPGGGRRAESRAKSTPPSLSPPPIPPLVARTSWTPRRPTACG